MGVLLHNEETEIYSNRVLLLRERNGYDDSDFYAICWDDEKGKPVSIMYDTTRFGGGGGANIDATPETITKYQEYQKRLNEINSEIYKLEESLISNRKDNVVRINRGRKHKGEIGTIFTCGKNNFGPWVGLRFNDEKDEKGNWKNIAFVNAAYINVINHEEITEKLTELRKINITIK